MMEGEKGERILPVELGEGIQGGDDGGDDLMEGEVLIEDGAEGGADEGWQNAC
jgi:hypothetical protein